MSTLKLVIRHNEAHGHYMVDISGDPVDGDLSISVMENPLTGPSRCVGISSELLDKLISMRAIWDSTRRLDH